MITVNFAYLQCLLCYVDENLKNLQKVCTGGHVLLLVFFLWQRTSLAHDSFSVIPLPHMPILGSSDSASNKDMMAEYGQMGIQLSARVEKNCGKRRNCS